MCFTHFVTCGTLLSLINHSHVAIIVGSTVATSILFVVAYFIIPAVIWKKTSAITDEKTALIEALKQSEITYTETRNGCVNMLVGDRLIVAIPLKDKQLKVSLKRDGKTARTLTLGGRKINRVLARIIDDVFADKNYAGAYPLFCLVTRDKDEARLLQVKRHYGFVPLAICAYNDLCITEEYVSEVLMLAKLPAVSAKMKNRIFTTVNTSE